MPINVHGLDYAILVIFLFALLLGLFGLRGIELLRDPCYWVGLAAFLSFCTIVELVALASGWWQFQPEKILGPSFLGIPIEECIVFAGFHYLVVALWDQDLE